MNRNFSKEEAQRIFSLAAERQQTTQSKEADQLSLEDLEEAGLAAGIDPAFIRAAASDLLRPDRATEQRYFLGFPVELRESHILSIPYTDENWKKLVDIFTDVYKKPGVTREVGTTRRWQSEANDNQMPTQIIAEKDDQGTRITIERKMWPLSLGFWISSAVNLLIGFIFFAIWMSVGSADEMIIPASIMGGIGALLGIFGSMGTRMASNAELQRFEQVFSHLEKIASTGHQEAAQKTPSSRSTTSSPEITEQGLLDQMDLDDSESFAGASESAKSKVKN